MHIKLIFTLALLAIVSTTQTNAQEESSQLVALKKRIGRMEQIVHQISQRSFEVAGKLVGHERAVKNKEFISEEKQQEVVGLEEKGNRLAKQLARLNEELKEAKAQLLQAEHPEQPKGK